ncbi:putative tail fiber assembly protein [Escherichia coli]|nr:putative tail fiber assembly protein [Escherichia coli]
MCQIIVAKLSIALTLGIPKKSRCWVTIRKNTTTIAPLTPYDKWDGEKWVVDTEAQHSAAVEAAETKRQSLIDTAMDSISLIQLKLRAGGKLTQAETTQLNSVLDYIDELNAMDLTTAPRSQLA